MSFLFSYIKEDINNKKDFSNHFFKVEEFSVRETEKRLGFVFPSELRAFFFEIGYGFLTTKHGCKRDTFNINRIIDPESIAEIMIEDRDKSELHPETEFRPGEMPFFEIGEMRDFLTLYPLSDRPNAVYDNLTGKVVEESFSKFIWRLYYESPTFYLDV